MLLNEMSRTTELASTIEADKVALDHVDESYNLLSDVSSNARSLLRGIEINMVKESMLLYASLGFFYLVVLYIVFQRAWIPFLLT